MMNQTRDLIKPDMAELGADVVDVRILRTDLTDQVSAQTYDRMKAERLAQAALLRANGQQAAQTIKAIADRQAIEIVADATKDSDILRGQGDAQRSEIYAQAYNIDPGFYEFYRSMQAYRAGLGSSGTTMVLSPDSEFFHYFGNSGNAVVPPGAAAKIPAQASVVGPVPDVIPPADEDTPEPPMIGADGTDFRWRDDGRRNHRGAGNARADDAGSRSSDAPSCRPIERFPRRAGSGGLHRGTDLCRIPRADEEVAGDVQHPAGDAHPRRGAGWCGDWTGSAVPRPQLVHRLAVSTGQ